MSPGAREPGQKTAAKVRLFVALDLPAPVVEALVAWRAPLLRRLDALRPVAREALHVTLCFLGWKAPEAVDPLTVLVRTCATGSGGATGLALGEPLWLPPRGPRVLALALEDRHGLLGELQARLGEQLAGGGWYEPEARAYLPHVSLARVRRGARVPRVVELPPPPPLAFDGAAVTLYRSLLDPGGARYEPLFVGRLA